MPTRNIWVIPISTSDVRINTTQAQHTDMTDKPDWQNIVDAGFEADQTAISAAISELISSSLRIHGLKQYAKSDDLKQRLGMVQDLYREVTEELIEFSREMGYKINDDE